MSIECNDLTGCLNIVGTDKVAEEQFTALLDEVRHQLVKTRPTDENPVDTFKSEQFAHQNS